jgi:hypothetical protein
MNYKYFHDIDNKVVYRVPLDPTIREDRNRSGKTVTGWTVSVFVDITKAENRLINNIWEEAVRIQWEQSFENIGNRYNGEMVVEHFYNNHFPRCLEIDEAEYESVKQEYEKQARLNK